MLLTTVPVINARRKRTGFCTINPVYTIQTHHISIIIDLNHSRITNIQATYVQADKTHRGLRWK